MGNVAFRAVLILAGLACVACEMWGSYEFMIEKHGRWNYLVAGSLVVTALSALLPMAAEYAHRQGMKAMKWAVWCAIPLSLVFIFTVSIQRTGSVTDTDEAARQQIARSIQIAEAEIAEAQVQQVKDQAAIDAICAIWGPKCTMAREAKAATERKLAEARAVIKRQGIVVDDPLAKRLAAYFPFLTKEQVQLYHPLLVPLGLAILGSLMLAIGLRRKEQPAKAPEPAKPEPAPEPVAAPTQLKPAAPPRLVINNDVPAMLVKLVDPAPGERIQVCAVSSAYTTQCRAEGKEPASPDQLASGLKKFCKDAGIKTRTIKGQVYLLDIRLAAKHHAQGPQAPAVNTA